MDDSLPSGENKLPLFVSFGAIAVAVIALLFAFKARSDAKAASDSAKENKTTIELATAEVASVKSSAAKSSDVSAVRDEVGQLKGNFEAVVSEVNKNFQKQSEINKSFVASRGHATTATAPGGKAEATAGAGEYVIKSGDSFAKIARANGTTIAALTAANPGVSSLNLKVGQKIKLPEKKAPTTKAN